MFTTIVSIENIYIDFVTAYVNINFTSPQSANTHLGYFFAIEYLEKNNTILRLEEFTYWIDRYTHSDETDSYRNVSIRRNKNVTIPINLLHGIVRGNTAHSKIKLHLYEQARVDQDGEHHREKVVWSSDVLNLTMRPISLPIMKIEEAFIKNDVLHVAIATKYSTARDEIQGNNVLKKEVDLMNVYGTHSIGKLDLEDGYYKMTNVKDYRNKIVYIQVKTLLANTVVNREIFSARLGENFVAHKVGYHGMTMVYGIYRKGGTKLSPKTFNIIKIAKK